MTELTEPRQVTISSAPSGRLHVCDTCGRAVADVAQHRRECVDHELALFAIGRAS